MFKYHSRYKGLYPIKKHEFDQYTKGDHFCAAHITLKQPRSNRCIWFNIQHRSFQFILYIFNIFLSNGVCKPGIICIPAYFFLCWFLMFLKRLITFDGACRLLPLGRLPLWTAWNGKYRNRGCKKHTNEPCCAKRALGVFLIKIFIFLFSECTLFQN